MRIAYRLIAEKGFEGFRSREVASLAGINNATLHYYFPTKEDLVRAVVEYLVQEFSMNRASAQAKEGGAAEELRWEFEDVGIRMRETPEQLIVMGELSVRALRDPAIAQIMRRVQEGWRGSVIAILERGIREGVFRPDLDLISTANGIITLLKGLGSQSRLERKEVEDLVAEMARLAHQWVTGPF
ncbi:MAG TPA: TetR/AcrR family transcriptional regulator [Candidatus Acidoferrum sp.]|nr:TetR/AcrR family transcriptional regulator [Candidatus Acidoferrum sp.]